MPKFAAGVVRFQRDVYPHKQEFYDTLSTGQAPEALFITCSDSRIELGTLTQAQPGDLFVVRNAGNIVPPHSNSTGATTAAIEFAVGALKVSHIVICGHTDCGAMKGAVAPDKLDSLPHVRAWLGYARAAVEIVAAIGNDLTDQERMLLLLEQNVILQLQHLKTHPTVAVALATGSLQLHGWVYDIKAGEVYAYDEEIGDFKPVSERYAEQMKEFLSADLHDHG
ncbi:carbonic anhydrase [Polymorphobacter fuscus]|uniref:Carbonic anhydrase n=1 Tax=Sandarakinorhabdus fusca TaxID=1439888 RepID=A0A7C9KWX5_9SPHN|nr:carbonic anhydrase [Polymorphobacter fuscus]KAB7646182.1 carbonic anhydrase [Polymorphobacter fuscus]MQT17385.1 carbonic anhydrase [Polymorphobacter fuscus]NJC10081.1 carbonic anhydrase [Polymorphobacter fuscus]